MHIEHVTSPPVVAPPSGLGRRSGRRVLTVLTLAGLTLLGPACSQDTSEGGSSPEDQPTGGPQQPGGGEDDPTLSGEGDGAGDGAGEGNTGGDGSGGPDSESGSGGDTGVGGSPTGGEDG